MNNFNTLNFNSRQAVLPMLIQDYLDICDPVLTFDRLMGGIDLEKYLKNIQKHYTGRLRYNPVSMLKTVLFGFMTNVYISLRELEDQCRINLRYMYLMEHEKPSYRTFGIMKNDRWYKRIVRRGINSVRLEVFLVSIGHNLYKYHNKQMKSKKAA